MLKDVDIRILTKIIGKVYKEPDTEKVRLPSPEPYQVNLEEVFLEEVEKDITKTLSVHISHKAFWVSGAILALSAIGLFFTQYIFAWGVFPHITSKINLLNMVFGVIGAAMAGKLYLALKPLEYKTMKKTETILERKPVKSSRQITLGADDYPEKTVTLSTVREIQEETVSSKDAGPMPHYLVFSILAWVLGMFPVGMAIANGPARLPRAVYFALPWVSLVFIFSGFVLFSVLKARFRKTFAQTQTTISWEETTREETLHVKEAYKPKYEDRELPNPFRVTALGKINLPLQSVPYEHGVLLVDGTGIFQEIKVDFPRLKTPEIVTEISDRLKEAEQNIPAVLSSGKKIHQYLGVETAFGDQVALRGEEAGFVELFDEIGRQYEDYCIDSYETNLVKPGDPLLEAIEMDHGEEENSSLSNPDLASLMDLVENTQSLALGKFARDFIDKWRHNLLVLTGVRFEALHNNISPSMMEFGYISHYASFNFYCPSCNEDKIEKIMDRDYRVSGGKKNPPIGFSANSRCLFDVDTRQWHCLSCERRVKDPIPVHKALDEVLYPTYDRLIAENKQARFDLDNKTRDDELAYINKMDQELDSITRAISSQRYDLLQDIEMTNAVIAGHANAIESLRSLMDNYKVQQSKAMKEIASHNKELKEELETSTRAALKSIGEKTRDLIRAYQQEMDSISQSKKLEELKRDQMMAGMLNSMQVTAAASVQTAAATGKSAQHLEKIGNHTKRAAAASEKAAYHLNRVDQNTERTANTSEKSTEHLGKIKGHTANVGAGLSSLGKQMEQNNAIQAATAKKQGIDLHDYAWFRLDKSVPKIMADVGTTLKGGSEVDRAKAVGRALK